MNQDIQLHKIRYLLDFFLNYIHQSLICLGLDFIIFRHAFNLIIQVTSFKC